MPWNTTLFTKALDLLYPLIQAPMAGGFSTPKLAATVSNYGALGSIAAGYFQADELNIAIEQTKKATSKPVAINFFIPAHSHATSIQIHKMHKILQPFAEELEIDLPIPHPPFVPSLESQLAVFLDHRLHILSFTFGILDPSWIKILKEKKVTLIGTCTSAQEAKLLEQSGVHFIVCQGKEAGGHRGSFAHDARLPTFNLIKECAAQVKTPLIASGGIMNRDDITRALKLGAIAVQMGSAFLTTEEAGTSSLYKNALLQSSEGSTLLTRAFTGKYGRALKNHFITQIEHHADAILEYPIQHVLTSPIRKAAATQERSEFLSLWAGERFFECQKLSTTALLDFLIKGVE